MENLCHALPSERVGLHTKDSEELIETVKKAVKPSDIVMVKGSCHSSNVLDRIETSYPIEYEMIRQTSLMQSDFIEQSPIPMFEFGVVSLM